MKIKHDGDCTIYASLENGRPEDGICTCGYGRELVRQGNWEEMYSLDLQEKLIRENSRILDIEKRRGLVSKLVEDGKK